MTEKINSMLTVGQRIADFNLLDDKGELFKLSENLGKKNLVIYFYPKDNTLGCTIEACAFRDEYEAFEELNAMVIGISHDSPESHAKFKTKYKLPFTLLCDIDNEVSTLFNVKNDFFGMVPGRVTFIIDKEGILRYKFASHINFKKHIYESIKILKQLNYYS